MKRKNNFTMILVVLLTTFLNSIHAQSWGDYTLIAPQGSTTTKLVTLTGTVYKTWTLTGSNGYSSFLTPDRCIIRIVGGSGASAGSKIEKVNWDGQVVWSFAVGAHHDICYMPNGHVLAAVLTTATSTELSQYGFTGVTTSLKYDKIVEIDGVNGQIVWEWRFIDHTIQNTNSSLANYGDPASTPQKFNLAVPGSQGYSDWQHLNGIDYNPARDQIVFSSKHLKEIFVIDHSTTTAEAKTGTGGLSGKGGDFLYRWGNPTNYGKTGGTFGVIHDAAWCLGETYQAQREDPSAPNYHPFATMISVWSNTNVSGMCIIPPYIDSSYNFEYSTGTSYLPATYYKKVTLTGNSSNMGGNQMLPNGNMLLFAGSGASTVYEKDSTSGAIWSNNTVNGCSKVTRYSAAYVNGDYATICANTPIGSIDTTSTNNNQGIADLNRSKVTFKNPVTVGEILTINHLEENSSNVIQLFDINGRLIYSVSNSTQFVVPSCETGLYILKINNSCYKVIIKDNE